MASGLIKYLITDPNYKYKSFSDADFICFRDKTSNNIKDIAREFIKLAHSQNVKNIFISKHIELARKLNFNGVHLTSKQFDKIAYAKELSLKVIISCHDEEEIQKAIKYRANFITYSPIFETPNKAPSKGIDELKKICQKYNIPIFALGGIISDKHVCSLEGTGVYGFASIRYFMKKRA